MRTLTLTKPWGRHKAGASLPVLDPGVEWSRDAVDTQRAAQLVDDGFATFLAQQEKGKPSKKAKEA